MTANGRGGGDFFAALVVAVDVATRTGLLLLPRDADALLVGVAVAVGRVFAGALRVGLLPRGVGFNDVDKGNAAVAAAIAERPN